MSEVAWVKEFAQKVKSYVAQKLLPLEARVEALEDHATAPTKGQRDSTMLRRAAEELDELRERVEKLEEAIKCPRK